MKGLLLLTTTMLASMASVTALAVPKAVVSPETSLAPINFEETTPVCHEPFNQRRGTTLAPQFSPTHSWLSTPPPWRIQEGSKLANSLRALDAIGLSRITLLMSPTSMEERRPSWSTWSTFTLTINSEFDMISFVATDYVLLYNNCWSFADTWIRNIVEFASPSHHRRKQTKAFAESFHASTESQPFFAATDT